MGNCGTKPATNEGETPAQAEEIVVESRDTVVVDEELKVTKVEEKVIEEAIATPLQDETKEVEEATPSNTDKQAAAQAVVLADADADADADNK